MNTLQAIQGRRSIRRFEPREVSKEMIEQILRAGVLAPSAKNRQPWRFVVVSSSDGRAGLLAAMEEGIAASETYFKDDDIQMNYILPGAKNTLRIMREASAHILILNDEGEHPNRLWSDHYSALANVQSMGACIENMSLAAVELGLGSLWICDVFSAYDQILAWLGHPSRQLVAALSIGYAAESPAPRPRRSAAEVTTWR